MRKLLSIFFTVLVLWPLKANADEIRRFEFVNFTATYPTANYYPILTAYLFGEVDIDVTTGASSYINAEYITPDGWVRFLGPDEFMEYRYDFGYLLALPDDIHLFLPVTTLLNYNGSSICSLTNPCNGYTSSILADIGYDYNIAVTGSLAPIPEPSSLLMLATGMAVALALAGRKVYAP